MSVEFDEAFQQALHTARMILWDWRLGEPSMRWSSDASTFFGVPVGGDVREWWREVVHPRSWSTMEEMLRGAMDRTLVGAHLDFDWRGQMAVDGASTLPWYRTRATIERDAAGVPICMRGVTWDVTEQKRAADLTERREALFNAVLENSFDAVSLLDANGRLILSIPRRLPDAGDVGAPSDGTPWHRIHPDDRERSRAQFLQLVATPNGRSLTTLRVRVRGDVPGWRWIESASRNLLHDPNIRAVISVWRDVTDRVAIEERAREAQALLERAQEAGRVGCWWTEPGAEGELRLHWTPEVFRITGVSPTSFTGNLTAFLELVHPDDVAAVETRYQEAVREGRAYEIEHRMVRPDGTVIWVLGRADVFLDVRGRPVQLVGICQDITERKKLELALHQAQKLESIGRLAGGIAHDFNNLLTIIIGHGQEAQKAAGATSPAAKHLDAVQTAAARGADLTRRLLAFARKKALDVHAIDLNEQVQEVERLLRPTLAPHIDLTIRLGKGVGMVLADPGQVLQILMNLALNACDAMPKGGRLEISTGRILVFEGESRLGRELRPGPYAVLRVTDSGTGLSEEAERHLFEPFFTTKEVRKGTGLGLATCYGIIKQHGGHITVHSARGRGTTVEIFLPIADAPAVDPPLDEAPRPGTESVLVVDDDQFLRDLFADALESAGYRVHKAADAESALASSTPLLDLVITDVVLPGIDGPTLFSRLRVRHPHLRALFISGLDPDAIDAHRAADTGFLAKPFTLTRLLERTRALLDARPPSATPESATGSSDRNS
jgi:PAS domain S-box-containing protein